MSSEESEPSSNESTPTPEPTPKKSKAKPPAKKPKNDASSEDEAPKEEVKKQAKRRRQSADESEEEAPKKGKKGGDSKLPAPGAISLGGNRFVSVSDFKGKSYLNIREYYEKNGELLPGKKGVSLTEDQYKKLTKALPKFENDF